MSRADVQLHQRERLIRGMVEAVYAKGYAATSVADVLARARVSRSAFYEQFRDREDCFLACYDGGTSLLFDAIFTALERRGPWPERMRRVFGALLDTFAEHPQLARVCMVEALAAGPAANLRYRGALATLVSLVETDRSTHKDVPQIPKPLVFGLLGGCSALIYEEIVEGRTRQLPEKADELTRFWLAGFLGYEHVRDSKLTLGAATD